MTDESDFDAENAWYHDAPPARLAKALAQYDVYRSIAALPGEVAEFGVFKAASLIRLATFREVLETAQARRIIAFDAFGAFPPPRENAGTGDEAYVEHHTRAAGDGLSVEATRSILERKQFANVELVAGDITDTLPAFLEQNAAARFALVHVDVDLKPVTRLVLELCAPRIVPGGVLMLDDYARVAAATEAVDEFLAVAPPGFELTRSPLAYAPSLLTRRAR